jgi:hypothetical protein
MSIYGTLQWLLSFVTGIREEIKNDHDKISLMEEKLNHLEKDQVKLEEKVDHLEKDQVKLEEKVENNKESNMDHFEEFSINVRMELKKELTRMIETITKNQLHDELKDTIVKKQKNKVHEQIKTFVLENELKSKLDEVKEKAKELDQLIDN